MIVSTVEYCFYCIFTFLLNYLNLLLIYYLLLLLREQYYILHNIYFGCQVIHKAVKLCCRCSLLYSLIFQHPSYLWVPAHVIGLPFVDINQKFIVYKSQLDLQCATASAVAFQSTRHMLPAVLAYKCSDTMINLAQLTLGKVKGRGLQRRHKWTKGNEAKIQLK